MDGRTAPERTRARKNALFWLVLAAAIVAGAVVLFLRDRAPLTPETPSLDPLALVPPGPAFVLTIDVARLRGDARLAELLGKELERFDAGAGRAAFRDCVPKLSRDVQRVAVAVTPTSAFAIIASGRFKKTAALECALASVGSGAAMRTTIGSFETVRDPTKSGELAARDGLLVVGEGDYFRNVLDRVEGHQRAAATPDDRDRLHAELRRTVGQGAPVVASLVLPRGWLGTVMGDAEAERSPLAVLRTAALRANVTSSVEVAGTAICENEADAARLERFLMALRADLGGEHVEGAVSLLTALAVVRRGAALDFSGRFDTGDVVKLVAP